MKVLVLTDHGGHGPSNSLYPIINALRIDSRVSEIYIASRTDTRNVPFFDAHTFHQVYAHKVENDIEHASFDELYNLSTAQISLDHFDMVLMRLPRPVSDAFLIALREVFKDRWIVNDPMGIIATSNKAYLLNYTRWTPEISLCKSIDCVMDMYNRFPVVLKPLTDYGGRGLVKIENDKVNTNGLNIPLDLWRRKYERFPEEYLAMRYLKNVSQGDKRIIVANGTIMGASLRLPPEGEWLCNVAQGGTSIIGDVTDRERDIVEDITPDLTSKGIFMYGLDTLVDDDGQRVISEINTLSVGGIYAVQTLSSDPIADKIVDQLFKFLNDSN
jgi:glutathione synthase